MPEPAKPSIAARLAIYYITIGALLDVWSAIYYAFYLRTAESDHRTFWCAGFFFTGLTLTIIGFTLGRIGRAARHADLPPDPPRVPAPQPALPTTAPAAIPAMPAAVVQPVPAAPVRR